MRSYRLKIVDDYKEIPSTPLDWGDVGDIAITEIAEQYGDTIVACGWFLYRGVCVEVEMDWAPGDYPDEYWEHGKEITPETFWKYYEDTIRYNVPFPFDLEYIAPVDGATVYIHKADIEDGTIEDFIEEYGDEKSAFRDLCEFLKKEVASWKN